MGDAALSESGALTAYAFLPDESIIVELLKRPRGAGLKGHLPFLARYSTSVRSRAITSGAGNSLREKLEAGKTTLSARERDRGKDGTSSSANS